MNKLIIRCGERKWANGWRKIPLHYGAIIRLHIRCYCCLKEGYSIYIGKASTLYCRRAKIIIIIYTPIILLLLPLILLINSIRLFYYYYYYHYYCYYCYHYCYTTTRINSRFYCSRAGTIYTSSTTTDTTTTTTATTIIILVTTTTIVILLLQCWYTSTTINTTTTATTSSRTYCAAAVRMYGVKHQPETRAKKAVNVMIIRTSKFAAKCKY